MQYNVCGPVACARTFCRVNCLLFSRCSSLTLIELLNVCVYAHYVLKYYKMGVSQEIHSVTTPVLEDRGSKLFVLLVALLFRNNRQVRH